MDPKIILHNSLKSDETPNLLLYGFNCREILMNTMDDFYKVSKRELIHIGDINYYKTNYYYEFNVESVIIKNTSKFIEIINEITSCKNYYSDKKLKIIILNNFNGIKLSIQNILRVIIEKYRSTTIFICITRKFNSVINPLRSRFLCLRFPQLTQKGKRQILYQINTPSKISEKYFDFIYTLKNKEEIESSINLGGVIDDNYKRPNVLIIKKIIDIYENSTYNKKDYDKLKDISHNIIKFNLDISEFHNEFLSELLTKTTIRDKIKIKLVKLFADSEYNYHKSYRSLIILEALLFNVFYICYNKVVGKLYES